MSTNDASKLPELPPRPATDAEAERVQGGFIFEILSDAVATVIKSAGDALSTAARKG